MTPSSAQGAGAAPLMGTAGVTDLFFPAIDEEEEEVRAAANGRAPQQRLPPRPAAGTERKEDPCSAGAGLAEEACGSIPRPEGCGSGGTACAVEAQTPPAAEVTPTGDGGDSAAAGANSMIIGEGEEASPAGGTLAIVVRPGVPAVYAALALSKAAAMHEDSGLCA